MKKRVKKLVLSKETVLRMQGAQASAVLGGNGTRGDSLTNCQAISCIGDMCADTDAPCIAESV